jgi:hypothetical protein
MRKTQDGLEITAEELAESLQRAWNAASGETREWESLSADEQARWHRAVRGASLRLPTMDGKPMVDGARLLIEEWAGDDDALRRQQEAYLTEWEACVRHLNCLIDCDELENENDVRALEASWANWAQRKPRRQLVTQ